VKRQCPLQDQNSGSLYETNLDYDEKTFQCQYYQMVNESEEDTEEAQNRNFHCFYEKSTGALSKDDDSRESFMTEPSPRRSLSVVCIHAPHAPHRKLLKVLYTEHFLLGHENITDACYGQAGPPPGKLWQCPDSDTKSNPLSDTERSASDDKNTLTCVYPSKDDEKLSCPYDIVTGGMADEDDDDEELGEFCSEKERASVSVCCVALAGGRPARRSIRNCFFNRFTPF
jgi:hypothetical protein